MLTFHVLESRGELEIFPGGEGARALPDAELPARQTADASLGGRVAEPGIMQPSDWGVQGLGTKVGCRRDARTGAACIVDMAGEHRLTDPLREVVSACA